MHQALATGVGAGGGGVPSGGTPQVIATWSNSSGNTTITRGGSQEIDIITVTGSAGTRVFILDTTNAQQGDVHSLRFQQPATAGIIEEVRNATAGGTLIYQYTTDGSGTDTFASEVYFDGSAWQPLTQAVPVI